MHREAGLVVSKKVLELLSDLSNGHAAVSSLVASSIFRKQHELQLQCAAVLQKAGGIQNQSDTSESKLSKE